MMVGGRIAPDDRGGDREIDEDREEILDYRG
jgi:hypothetical protein